MEVCSRKEMNEITDDKMDYLCVNERNLRGIVRLQGAKVGKVEEGFRCDV